MKKLFSGPASREEFRVFEWACSAAKCPIAFVVGLALAWMPQQALAGNGFTTVTTLTASPTSVTYGTPISLSAMVVTNTDVAVTVGQVAFCNSTAAVCNAQVNLGLAQLNANATAVLKLAAGTIGSHSFVAKFVGKTNYAASTSTAQTVTVTGTYPTTTTLVASGDPGSYTLTASVIGTGYAAAGPTGTVSFNNTTASPAMALGTAMLGTAATGFAEIQATGSPLTTGAGPTELATGDFNGDGFADVAVANFGGNTVSVLLGNGDGTFKPQTTYATGNGCYTVQVADFNGDGHLDLVVGNQSDGTVGILLGNGDGTFQAQATYAVSAPLSLAVMDLNGDGIADIVAGSMSSNTVSVLLGKGDGTFGAAVSYTAGSGPNAVAEGDFNGDGIADLSVANYYDGTVSILLGKGDGTFQQQTTYSVGNDPNTIATGDLNGDGIPDIAVTNIGDSTVSVLLGKGDGTFQPQTTYSVNAEAGGVAIADFNGDGFPDIAVESSSANTVGLLLGNGDGTFQSQITYSTGSHPNFLAVADFNGDGFPDIASANYSDGSATILLSEEVSTAMATLSNVAPQGSGTVNVDASYPGDTNYGSSVSATTPLMAGGGTLVGTSTSVIVSPSTAVAGATVTLSAQVTPASGTGVPTGTITFLDGDNTLGTATLTGGSASYATTTLTVGTHNISASYSGDSNFSSSSSSPQTVVITSPPPATMTSLTVTSGGSAVTSVAAGSVVTLTATLAAGTTAVTPGQVEFCDASVARCADSHLLATAQLVSTGEGPGTATYSFVPGLGAHSYRAVFVGTASYAASASEIVGLTVTGKYPTATTLAQSGSGGSYNLTATTVGAGAYPVANATQSVTINLGQSAQQYVLTGTGASTMNGATYGNYYNTQGSCVTKGTTTTCDLTGTFTSSTSGYASGTYDFQTVFSGNISNAVLSQTQYPVGTNEPNDFDYSAFASSTVMTLLLNVTGGGAYSIPVVEKGDFDPNLDDLNFAFTSTACGGTSLGSDPCQQDYVGTVAGATISGPITGLVEFELPTPPTLVGPTGTVTFNNTTSGTAVSLGTAALGTATPGFTTAQASGSPNKVGSEPYGAAAGDFNGDGFTDLVIENYGDGTVSVLLGKGDGTFQPQVKYQVGTEPERVLVADMNGDGKLDLIVANTGSSSISILLGNGDGTFQAQATYQCGSPVGLGVMDINHDGIPDVVAGDYYDGTISVLLGNGDGTLQTAVTYTTGNTPQTLAEGDFNGDGNVDVVVGNLNDNDVGVFLGNGDGTFQAMVTYPVGKAPQGVQAADLNGDGFEDLAVVNSGDNTVSVLLGKGDGTFQTQATYPVGVDPVGLVVADLNGDGNLDIAVNNTDQTALSESILLGNGDGTFQTQLVYPTGNFPYASTAGDFNGDGYPDLEISNFNDGTATILLSVVTETATASISTTVGGSSNTTETVVANYAGDTNFSASVSSPIQLSGGGTSSSISTQTQLSVSPTTAAAGTNVNFTATVMPASGDGSPTGTVTFSDGENMLGTATLSEGQATFSTNSLTVGTHNIVATYSGDENYSSSTSPSQTVTINAAPVATSTTLSVSSATVAYETPVILTANVTANADISLVGQVAFCASTATSCNAESNLGVAQLNGESTAVLSLSAGTIGAHSFTATYLGTTAATSGQAVGASTSPPQTVTVTGTYPTTTTIASTGTVGDYSLTGTVVGTGDVKAGPTGTVSFLNTSSGNASLGTASLGTSVAGLGFKDGTSATTLNYPQGRAAVGDFNGDGFADLAFANSAPYATDTTNANTVTIALGNGDGTFQTLATTPATGAAPGSIVAADFNGDGKLDLATANYNGNSVTVLLGNGDGTFTAGPATPSVGTGPYTIVAADFNGDGIVDLAVSTNTNAVTILLGNGDGTFSASTVTVSGDFAAMVVGDFNGDGIPDLAVQNIYPTSELEILMGNGDGTFTVGTPIAEGTGSNLNNVAAGDLNGDGLTDLVITNQQNSTVTALLSKGDGTFTQIPVASSTGTGPGDVQIADFNSDGFPDIAITYDTTGQNGLQVLPGNGDGTFTKPAVSTGSTVFAGISIGDYNGDGIPDIASSNATTQLDIALTQITQTATATLSNVAPAGTGMVSVDASYAGDTNFSASKSGTVQLTGGSNAATPTIASITPSETAVSTTSLPITIAGTNFVSTSVALVNGTAATTTYVSATKLTATVPATDLASAGTLKIAVQTPVTGASPLTSGTVNLTVVPDLVLGSISPTQVPQGSPVTTLTVTGQNFTATTVVEFASGPGGGIATNATPLATTFISATQLTAVLPATLLTTAENASILTFDAASGSVSTAATFTILGTANVTFTGPPTATPGGQPAITFQIAQAYSLPVNGTVTVVFTPAEGLPDDPTVLLGNGTRTQSFTLAAGSTATPAILLQAGTTAGTITVSLALTSNSVTVATVAPIVIDVPKAAPVITSATLTRSSTTATLTIKGLSSTRELTVGGFTFTPTSGNTFTKPAFSLPVTPIFVAWYTQAASDQYGTAFTYTQTFDLSGSATEVQSVAVTLANSIGVSNNVSAK